MTLNDAETDFLSVFGKSRSVVSDPPFQSKASVTANARVLSVIPEGVIAALSAGGSNMRQSQRGFAFRFPLELVSIKDINPRKAIIGISYQVRGFIAKPVGFRGLIVGYIGKKKLRRSAGPVNVATFATLFEMSGIWSFRIPSWAGREILPTLPVFNVRIEVHLKGGSPTENAEIGIDTLDFELLQK